ncbi:MAG: hypothetical protein JXB49_31385 [Bacteroidales bacterium]|nr:hypothetical protein [Bacteroidales bacterium]
MSDYLKYLTGLSTGSLILLTTFLDKLFIQPVWKYLVSISLISFMISVFTSVIAQTMLVFLLSKLDPESSRRFLVSVFMYAIIFTWIAFMIGIISLTTFALKNL